MKNVAKYLRLSKEDEYIRDESNSITNQRKLITKYIRSVPEFRGMETVEYKDDGYTGKSMERPGLQELLSQVKEGKIAAIVVKDISRFSRDHLVSGKYLEQIFPFMGVRFIAINDGYDSNNFKGGIGEIDVAFKEILYDFYSEDLSVKIKSSLQSAKRNGKYQAANPPYGYVRNPHDHHKVIIDDETADVVREMFRRVLAGDSINKITKDFNEAGVESPAEYKKRKFGVNCNRWKTKGIWHYATIARMLHDEFYIGTYVYHKSERNEVAGENIRIKDESQWMRIENHHEPLVSREDYDKAQAIIRSREKKHKSPRRGHPLVGKVVCGVCGSKMEHRWQGRPKCFCRAAYGGGAQWHERNAINDEDSHKIILVEMQNEVAIRADTGKVRQESKAVWQRRLEEAEKRLSGMELELARLHRDQKKAYESYRLGDMNRDTFLERKERLNRTEEDMLAGIEGQRKEVSRIEDEENGFRGGISWDGKALSFDELTWEMVEIFIDHVTVWPGGKMEIAWKFGTK